MKAFNFIKKIVKPLLRTIFMPSIGQLEETATLIWEEVNSPQYDWGNWDVEAPVTTEGWSSYNGCRHSAALTLIGGKTMFNLLIITTALKFRTKSAKRRKIHVMVAHEYRHACQFNVLGEYAFVAMQKDALYKYGKGPLEQDAKAFSTGYVTPWKEFIESLDMGLEYKE